MQEFENLEQLSNNHLEMSAEDYVDRQREIRAIKGGKKGFAPNPTANTPRYVAQVDMTMKIVQGGSGGGAPAVGSAEKFPILMFGNIDSAADYTVSMRSFPLLDPNYVYQGIYSVPDAGLNGLIGSPIGIPGVANGDVAFLWLNPVNGDWIASIVHCNQLPYASLLAASSSDRFVINKVRYGVASPAVLTQYNEQMLWARQGLFGKKTDDSINPNSFKSPMQQQVNLIDMDVRLPIDKYAVVGSYILQNEIATWSLFIESEIKLTV